MSLEQTSALEASFKGLVDFLRQQMQAGGQFTLTLMAERSQFTRFNRARIRQSGLVADGIVTLTLMANQRHSYQAFPFTGDRTQDCKTAQTALESLRVEVPQLPVDPYLVIPSGSSTSYEVHPGKLLTSEASIAALMAPASDLDFTGIYVAGPVIRAYADSNGQYHWFATESFILDYSLFTAEGQAVKGILAGSEWDEAAYAAKIEDSRSQLQQMAQPAKPIQRGQYRTYLAPAAVADIVWMLSWGGLSEAELQQGGSCLGQMRRNGKRLSPQFTLKENFRHGLVPRFNELGEIAPEELPLIQSGELVNTLVNSRTAKEYGTTANGANSEEGQRSPEIVSGTLAADRILAELDTGLYVSNLHYLNWSDRPNGRITGMTRYACFWVEKGEIVAPIENLRFDDSLYRFWGDHLLALTDFQEFIPDTGTYDHRNLGGAWVPGMLVEGFTYTF